MSPIVNRKQSIGFPEIGQIRKGMPKTANRPGQDLKTRFRVAFAEGARNEESKARFIQAYRERGLEIVDGQLVVERLLVYLPFQVDQVFDSWYEAYTAGRMVARADGEKFIRLVDTATGRVIVSGGEPYTPFDPREPVGTYVNRKQNREEPVFARATGRLKVVLPELARMAHLTLMTTSIYDVVRITEQLQALAFIARMLPKANAISGIPLELTRRLTEVTWTQPDGSARRVKHGLINIEADPDWFQEMLHYMAQMALPAENLGRALLPAGDQVELGIGEEHQVQAELEAEHGAAEDGLDEDAPGQAVDAPEPEPEPVRLLNGRPYDLNTLRDRLAQFEAGYAGKTASRAQIGLVAMLMEKAFATDDAAERRKTVLFALFGKESLNDLPGPMIFTLLNDWLKPDKDSGGDYLPDPMAVREIQAAHTEALRIEGQLELM